MNKQTEKIIVAAKAGGEILNKYFGQSLETTQKSIVSDFRTKADLESEEQILKILNQEFPDYNIISEEMGERNNNSEYTFFIDPLDGTNNFVLGLPNFSVSIGLLKDDEIITGVVYVPFMDRTYWAEKGKGSFLENKRLKVNDESNILKSSISIVIGYTTSPSFQGNLIKKLMDKNLKRHLVNWSVAYDLCLLASGKIEGIINNNNDLWDYVAGKLIVTEAGGLVTDFMGKKASDKESVFIASNGSGIHQKLVGML